MKSIKLGGKWGFVTYLDAKFQPVTPEEGIMAKVVFKDGTRTFFTYYKKETK